MHGVFEIARTGTAGSVENKDVSARLGLGAAIALCAAIVVELRRANAASHRYEQMKGMRSAHEVSTARRIYMEFYSEE